MVQLVTVAVTAMAGVGVRCRAGTITKLYFGSDLELLDHADGTPVT
jgi:hypothetical protein